MNLEKDPTVCVLRPILAVKAHGESRILLIFQHIYGLFGSYRHTPSTVC